MRGKQEEAREKPKQKWNSSEVVVVLGRHVPGITRRCEEKHEILQSGEDWAEGVSGERKERKEGKPEGKAS